jgi:hypothetical protein
MMLVTLQQAKDHLRRPASSADNSDLTLKIHAASAVVLNYLEEGATFLDSAGDLPVDSNGDALDVPYEVQAATLLMVGELYMNRGGSENKTFSDSDLPAPVKSLLYPLRVPTAL